MVPHLASFTLKQSQEHKYSVQVFCKFRFFEISSDVCDLSVQLLPYFVATIFADLPGLSGLFLASLYAGALR